MIQKIVDRITNFTNKYLMKSGNEYLELRYGLAVIVINFLKIASVMLVASILGIQNYVVIYFIVFALIRMFAFGAHASKSILCTILNFTVFIGGVYLSLIIQFDNYDVISIFLINIFLLYKYAPAATKKRPITSRNMILKCKIRSIVVTLVLMILAIWVNIGIYKTLITLATFTGCVCITPVVYKLLGEEYLYYEGICV